MKWDSEARARLLSCADDDALRSEFPGHNLEGLKRRRREARIDPEPVDRAAIVSKIEKLLADSNIDIDDVERLEKFTHKQWQGMTKDTDGNPVVTPLEGSSIVLKPRAPAGPAWPVVQPGNAIVIKAPKVKRAAKTPGEWRTAVILPDPQIGYRRDLDTMELDPFHCERSMDVALQVCALVEPDLIVNLGDLLDLNEFSRFELEPGFALTTQPSIYRAQEFLGAQRAIAPKADIRLLEGNHDARLPRQIIANAKAAFSLKRAPDEWPVLSVPNLLRLDDLGVEYVPGYPAGITWINDRLACVHGSKVRSNGSTAAGVIDDERVSVIFGHIHRIEMQHKTRRTRNGGRSSLAASPGCLCRIDGAVPGVRGATDPLGKAVDAVENWQNGLAVVTFKDGDSPFALELIPIHGGTTIFRGQALEAAS